MTTLEIGKRLVELCKQNKHKDAMEELYSPDVVSVEPMPNGETRGLQTQVTKMAAIRAGLTIHSGTCEGPYPHGDRFIVHFTRDATDNATKVQRKVDEMGLYTVENGKITRTEFFFVVA